MDKTAVVNRNITANRFNGFPKETLDFLFNLKFNNTIFNEKENLIQYQNLITRPLRRLYDELIPAVLQISPRFDTKPSRCISTPYTDRRFSPSVPLKEYMYIRFKYADLSDNIPGFYFDMGCEHYSYGLRIYRQTIKGMDGIREKISNRPEKFSDSLNRLADKGFSVIGESYKKDKIPEMSDCAAKSLYNRKSFYIGKNAEINKNVFSHMLAEEIKEGFLAVSEILNLI